MADSHDRASRAQAEPSRTPVGAQEVRAALARLGEAGPRLAARPLAKRIEPLCELLDRLAAPGSELRGALARALQDHSGFDPATLRAGLAHALERWSGKALRQLVSADLGASQGRVAQGFPVTALLAGGSLPMPGLLSMLLPLALGSPILVRPGRHDRVTARFVIEALTALDAGLAECLACVDFAHDDEDALRALLSAPCVVATGSDETMRQVAAATPPSTRLVRYGHRFSVAVWALAPGADAAGSARALAEDVSSWDQLGCLSPLVVYVASPGGRVSAGVEEVIAEALEEVAGRWPRGRVDATARALASHEAGTAELRAGVDDGVRLRRGRDWTLVCEADARMRAAPLHRFLRLHPVADAAALGAALAPSSRQLAAVGITRGAGSDWQRAVVSAGPSRICELGQMQAPPLGWSHDGQGPLRPLVRFTDVEVPFERPSDGGEASG